MRSILSTIYQKNSTEIFLLNLTYIYLLLLYYTILNQLEKMYDLLTQKAGMSEKNFFLSGIPAYDVV